MLSGGDHLIHITGDTHGDFGRYYDFVEKSKPTKNDVMIVLDDAGLNYYGNERDESHKSFVNNLSFTTFCIHGNHENRPYDNQTMKQNNSMAVLFDMGIKCD